MDIPIPFDGNEDRFDRWKFLQDILEGDASPDVVNIILYRVLEGALKYPRPSTGEVGGDKEAKVVETTVEVKEKIERLLATLMGGQVTTVLATDSDCNNADEKKAGEESVLAILDQFEAILPDPVEEEDDFKSLWDTIIELHGREAVKIKELQNHVSLDWKVSNTVVRTLIHFDFLTFGIVNAPLA